MNLMERDSYVVARLAALKAQGLSDTQAVNELVRTAGVGNISLPGHDVPALFTDVTGIASAVAALTVPVTRAATTVAATQTGGKVALHPPPRGLSPSDVWQLRALSGGA